MQAARLFRRVGAVVGLALPTVVLPMAVIDAAVVKAAQTGEEHSSSPNAGPAAFRGPGALIAAAYRAPAGGRVVVDDSVLTLSVTVQGRRVGDPDDPLVEVPAGEPVNVVYHLSNNTLFDVIGVRVDDPVVGGDAVTCPEGGATVSDLRPLSSVDCSASVPSVPGTHSGFASAAGTQTIVLVPYAVAGEAWIGYVGLAPPPPPSASASPTPPATHLPTPRSAPPPPRPSSQPPGAAVPFIPNPLTSPSATPTPSASPSRSAPVLYRSLMATMPAAPPRPGIPTPLFVLIMAMPAAAAAAAALHRRK